MQNVQKNLSRVFALALLLMVSTIAWAQQRITGTVQDGKGEPLIGVSVMEAGTTNGTTTNVNVSTSPTLATPSRPYRPATV